MGYIDLTRLPPSATTRRFLDTLRVDSPVALHTRSADADVISNGIVSSVGESIMACMPLLTRAPDRLLQRPCPVIELNDGRPLRKGMFRQGQHIHVIERYPSGLSTMTSGEVTATVADAFQVGHVWFYYRPVSGPPRRKVTVML